MRHLGLRFGTVSCVLALCAITDAFFWIPQQGSRRIHQNPLPSKGQKATDRTSYDFIVVGGGTAGLVVASRLAEIRQWQVLVIEAGSAHNTVQDWKLTSEPQPQACAASNEQRCEIPSAKGLAGNTRNNNMLYVRGTREDYDAWARKGNAEWSYRNVLPYFMKLENTRLNYSRELRGKGGPLTVTTLRQKSSLVDTFIAASQRYGLRTVDYNSDTNGTVGYVQLTRRQGKRVTSADAYLKPVRALFTNLYIMTEARVTKILIDRRTNTANGVLVMVQGVQRKIQATREIILAAGPIFTPHLLLLSGVGPKEQLSAFNITVLADLPVGKAMTVRAVSFPLHFITNTTVDPSAPTQTKLEAIAFVNAMQRSMDALSTPTHEILFQYEPRANRERIAIGLIHLHPSSKGSLRLKTANPLSDPLIYANIFADPSDMNEVLRGIGVCLKILNGTEFRRFGLRPQKLKLSPCQNIPYATDDYWRCVVRQVGHVAEQPYGTCPMGSPRDSSTVVSPELRVHGIEGLRIVDASVMLPVSNAHNQATVYMIAEKASDLIKSAWDWGNEEEAL
ncbi:glucose dehydrogenase [FAD, quinone]-like [Anopheles albimanus]|uniref:Glucose-methanol-choline oxidoreductase N-terminal domain-containing protein n=1 Tax=Anopheles albimanus TaxID=7167 RepID=A0A182G082_ANOAL|nr:glucose dehydrogenase [FAD, quinone]-like [Anopheles albimanus]